MSSRYINFAGWSLTEAASHLCGEQTVLECLLQDRVVAATTDENTLQILEILESNRWQKIEILDWSQSSARDGSSRRKLRGLRIFPSVHSPNASRRLAGGNLSDVILREVFHDPEVQLLAGPMLAEDNLHAATFGEGQYPGITIDFEWPVQLKAESLVFRLANPGFIFLEDPPIVASAAVRRAAETIADRWHALFSLLIRGELVALGTYVSTGQHSAISPQQWSRANAWVDVQNGDLLEEIDNKTTVRWSGLYLEAAPPPQTFHVKPLIYDSPLSKTIQHVRSRSHRSASVIEAIENLWSNGIPESMSAKERNAKIMDWLSERGFAVASVRTIERVMKNMLK